MEPENGEYCSSVSISNSETEKTVHSLFNITLKFVSENVIFIECLKDFPELIGCSIFKAAVHNGIFINNYFSAVRVAELFTSAYQHVILSSLCLSNHVLVINTFLDPLLKLTEFLTALDVRSCHLGDNHEFISYIGKMKSLRKLCLKDNCLTDNGMRKVTLPARMFNEGPLDLKELDVSDNQNLTDAFVVWLPKFKNLTVLDLCGTSVTECGLGYLMDKCNLAPGRENLTPIDTIGWAAPVILQWREYCKEKKKPKSSQLTRTFYSKSRHEKTPSQSAHHVSDIAHIPQLMKLKRIHSKKLPAYHKKTAVNSFPDLTVHLEHRKVTKKLKTIKDDLFSQYL